MRAACAQQLSGIRSNGNLPQPLAPHLASGGGRQLSQIFSLFVRRLQSLISDIRMELIVNEACSVQRAAMRHHLSLYRIGHWLMQMQLGK